MCASLEKLLGLMSYLFARRIAVHISLSLSPRKKGCRKVVNETKLGRSKIDGLRVGIGYVGK